MDTSQSFHPWITLTDPDFPSWGTLSSSNEELTSIDSKNPGRHTPSHRPLQQRLIRYFVPAPSMSSLPGIVG